MKLTIFYIDDEPMICENFHDEFESDDLDIRTFVNPDEAISEATKSPPSLIFIDYRFPRATGETVANALPPNIPKVLVSGDLNIRTKYNFLAVLSKPASSDDIWQIINNERQKAL